MKEALFYVKLNEKKVQCNLCAHNCFINDTQFGKCKVRQNIDGTLYAINYGKIVALSVDNIEKKPLYHYYPGSKTLSFAIAGCNLKCSFCQNFNISQEHKNIQTENLMPEDIIKIAKAKNIQIISYTYTEPTVYYEFMIETQMLAKANNLKNVVVSNGFMSEQVLSNLLKYTDAFNIDLKSFRQNNYNLLDGSLDIVLNNLSSIAKSKAWLEITTLLIPEFNNSFEELEDLASYISNLNYNIPWHISSYYKTYKATYKDTTLNDLKQAYAIGLAANLKYVYLGNIDDEESSSTKCYNCGTLLILRSGSMFNGYSNSNFLNFKNKCTNCGSKIDGVF